MREFLADIDMGGNALRRFRVDPMTTADRDTLGAALGPDDAGREVYDLTQKLSYQWDGTAWAAGGAGFASGLHFDPVDRLGKLGGALLEDTTLSGGSSHKLALLGLSEMDVDAQLHSWKVAGVEQMRLDSKLTLSVPLQQYTTLVQPAGTSGLQYYDLLGGQFMGYRAGAWKPFLMQGDVLPYTLPAASATVLGGIKIGAGLSIDAGGVLTNTGTSLAATQIAYGTGTGITSSPSFIYNASGQVGIGGATFVGSEKLRVSGDTRMDGNLTMVGSSVGNTTNSASFVASKIDWTITPNGFGQIFYGLQINAPTVNNPAQSPVYYGLYVNTTAVINKLYTQGNGFILYDNTFALVSNGRVNIGASNYGGGTTGMLQINIAGTSGVAPFAVSNDITTLASIGRDGSAFFNGIGVGNSQGVAGSGHWIGYDTSYPNDIVITPQSKNLRLLQHGVNYPEKRLLIGNVTDDTTTKVQVEGGVLVNGDINITGHYKTALGGGFINLYVDSGTTKNPQFLFGTTVAGGNAQWSIQGDGTTQYGALDIYAVTSTGANIASTNKAFNVRTGNTHILSLYGNGNAGLPTANASFAIGSTTTADFGTLLLYNSGNTKIGFPGASAVTNAGLTVATRDDTANKEYMLNAGNDSTGSWLQSRWTSGFSGTNYSNFFLNPNGGSVVVGATALNGSEKLRVNGDTYIDKSIRLGSQTIDPTSPANGLLYYNSTSNKFRGYRNGAMLDFYMKGDVAGGTIIWVDKNNPNATDTRTGISKYSYDAPFLTVQAAATAMVAGDIVQVMSGTYNETVTFAAVGSGSWANFILYNAHITQISCPVQNNVNLSILGFGSLAQVDTVAGFNSNTFMNLERITVSNVTNSAATSTFKNLTITTSNYMWAGIFTDCTISSTALTVYQNYSMNLGCTFIRCSIKNTTGGFISGPGVTSAGSPIILFDRCTVSVNGNFLSSRGAPIFNLKDCYITFNGYFYHDDDYANNGASVAVQTIRVHDCYLFNNAVAGTALFTSMNPTHDVVEWGNITRNSNTLGTMPTAFNTFGYDNYSTIISYY